MKSYQPGDVLYDRARKVFNGLINNQPTQIFKPSTKTEIREIIHFARDNNLTISIKNGGHSSYGISVSRSGIMIDMSNFDQIEISPTHHEIKVGGGVLSGDLDLAMSKYGLAIPLGDCPDVGVCGLALGGGFGFLSRKYGLASDYIKAIEMITAKGEMIMVSKGQNPELFRAMKGAGQNNFGVVTSIIFDVIKTPKEVTVYNYFWPIEKAPEVMQIMQEQLVKNQESLALYTRINQELIASPTIRLYGMYPGVNKSAEIVKKELNRINSSLVSQCAITSYYKAQQINRSSITPNISFHWHSAVLRKQIGADLPGKIIDQYLKCPGVMGRINLDPIGGKMNNPVEEDAMISLRNGTYILSVIGVWQGKSENEAMYNWSKNCFSELTQDSAHFRYQNYAGQHDPLKTYFGNLTSSLLLLKNKWDQDGVFEGFLSNN